MFHFVENRRRYQEPNKWWKMVIWYGFQITMIVLMFINISYLCANWGNMIIKIDKDEVFLTFIGFLFAFAGINIYSIFNTNIEEEKERLNNLGEQYSQRLSDEINQMWYYQKNSLKLMDFYQLGQLITNTDKFNNQVYEWILSIQTIIQNFKTFIEKLRWIDPEFANEVKGSFIDICRGMRRTMELYQLRIKSGTSYFKEQEAQSVKKEFLEAVSELIKILRNLEGGMFPDEIKQKKNYTQAPREWKEIFGDFFNECKEKLKL